MSMYIDFDCADPDGKILGPNWPPNLCNPVPVMVEAIYTLAQAICDSGGVQGNEFRHVPEGTDSADFLSYFGGGISQHALVLEGYDNLWWTQNSGGLWRQANNFNFMVGQDADFADPSDPTPLELNALFTSGNIPSNSFVYVTATHTLYVNAAGTWIAYTDRSFRVGIAADFADDDNPTNIELLALFDGLCAEHAMVYNEANTTFYYTRTYGAGWNPIPLPSAQTIVDTRVNIHALETGGDLIPGNFYRINDNSSANAGDVVLEAIDENELSTFGYYFEPNAGKWLLCVYDILVGQITRMWDTYGNDVSGTTGVNSFPWGNSSLTNNRITLMSEVFEYSGDGTMADCTIKNTNCRLSNNTGTLQNLDLYYSDFQAEDNEGVISLIGVKYSQVDFSQNLATITDMNIRTSNVSMVGISSASIENNEIISSSFYMDSFQGTLESNRFERVNWSVESALGQISDNEFFRTTMTGASFNGKIRRNHVVASTITVSSTTVAFNFDDNAVNGGTLDFTSSSGDVTFNKLDNTSVTMTTLSGSFKFNDLKDATVSANSVTGTINNNFARNGTINATSFPGTMNDNQLRAGGVIAGNTITNSASVVSGNTVTGDAALTLTSAANVTCKDNKISAGLGLYSPDAQLNMTSSTTCTALGNTLTNGAFLSLQAAVTSEADGNTVLNDSSVALNSCEAVTLLENSFVEQSVMTAGSSKHMTIRRNRFANNHTSTISCPTGTTITVEYNTFELSGSLTMTNTVSASIFGNHLSTGTMSLVGGTSLVVSLNHVDHGTLSASSGAGGTVSGNIIDGQSTLSFGGQASTGDIENNGLHSGATMNCVNNAGTIFYNTITRSIITAAKSAGFNFLNNVYSNMATFSVAGGVDDNNIRADDLAIAVASVTVANTVTETTLLPATLHGLKTIPANFFTVGKTILVKAGGFYSTDEDGTFNVRFKLGGNTIIAALSTDFGVYSGMVNTGWWMDLFLTCRSVGAGGTIIGQGVLNVSYGALGGQLAQMVNTVPVAINTTTALATDLTLQWDVAEALNSLTLTNFLISVMN